jgi:hypothetical protein
MGPCRQDDRVSGFEILIGDLADLANQVRNVPCGRDGGGRASDCDLIPTKSPGVIGIHPVQQRLVKFTKSTFRQLHVISDELFQPQDCLAQISYLSDVFPAA